MPGALVRTLVPTQPEVDAISPYAHPKGSYRLPPGRLILDEPSSCEPAQIRSGHSLVQVLDPPVDRHEAVDDDHACTPAVPSESVALSITLAPQPGQTQTVKLSLPTVTHRISFCGVQVKKQLGQRTLISHITAGPVR
jgi:hypothetical protein